MIEAVAGVPGVARDDITTLDVSVQPEYAYSSDGAAPRITGYKFSQRIQVGKLGKVDGVACTCYQQ